MSLKHREDSISGIRLRDAQKTKVATSAQLVGGSIVLELPEGGVCTGTMVKCVAPCPCTNVTGGIKIDGTLYTVVDAVGNCITGTVGYWDVGATLSFLIDSGNNRAFLQNAAWMPRGGGDFLGAVKAGASAQPPAQYLLRNSKLSPLTDVPETPEVEGEICWLYE